MTLHDANVQRVLNDEQREDARQLLAFTQDYQRTARHFGLTEAELRAELGLPQWRTIGGDA